MESNAATAALEGRYAALQACADQLSSEELLDVIELAQREKDAASARQAMALAHLSARDSHVQEDGTSAEVHHGLGYQRLDGPELVAPRLGCSVHVATNRILDAIRQMTRTPAVVDAMASGDLDEQRARTVTEETEFLSAESAAEVVERVKDVWGQLTVGPLRQLLARTAAQVDPDAVTAHAEDERARRGLTRRMGVHGTDHWRGDFRVEDARTAWAAVTERARQLVREGKADSLELARADAMMELILEHSDVKVVVHTTRAADTTTTEAAAEHSATDADQATSQTEAKPQTRTEAKTSTPAATTAQRQSQTQTQRQTQGQRQTESQGQSEGQSESQGQCQTEGQSESQGQCQTECQSESQGQCQTEGQSQSDVLPVVHRPSEGSSDAQGCTTGNTSNPAGAAPASSTPAASGTPFGEDLVEVGGLGAPGTTFVRRDWFDNAGTSDPERDLTCDKGTGALVHGDVPAAFARGQAQARRAHRSRERAKEAAERDTKRSDRSRTPASLTVEDIVEQAVDFSESYRVPDAMARLIRLRDGSCRFPGCAVTAHQCDLDHVRPWPAGPTTPTNLMCLCRRHHRIKQRDGWTAKLHPDGTVTWTDPTGRKQTTWPVDHLHLITASHAHRDATASSVRPGASEIPSTFEEALAELLDTHHIDRHAHTRPEGFTFDGKRFGGAPHPIDLDFSPGWDRYRLDFPPRPPQPPEVIPF